MKKIAIIGCYFGKLRNDYRTWLLSCKYNSTIDWIIFTDCNWGKVPENVKIVNFSFNYFKEYIQKKFKFKICLEKPYKICDYKPAFGYIFQEYLNNYDFWGYCDFDMIFGNIRSFITDDILENYDKIYTKGHLSLYKNNLEINNLFKSDIGSLYYKNVFTTNIIKVFDEDVGIYNIFLKNGYKVYDKYEYIDLNPFSKELININYTKLGNYRHQTIIFSEGKIYYIYKKKDNFVKKEVIYAHYSGKEFECKGKKTFQLTSKGIKEINSYDYFVYDCYCSIIFIKFKIMIKKFFFKLKRKLNKIRMSWIESYTNKGQFK